MAFSYSDENFTVVGNLCFTHIVFKTAGDHTIKIPPALADRILYMPYYVPYYNFQEDGSAGVSFANYENGTFTLNARYTNSYMSFFFPIDSNK